MSFKLARTTLIPRVLLAFIIALVLLHISAVVLKQLHPDNMAIATFSRTFDLDNERNVPTVYSSLILGMSAFCSVALSTRAKKWINKVVYYLFGIFFLYVAFDESLILHETSAAPIRDFLSIGDGSALYHAWVIPAAIVLSGVAGLYVFLRSKDKETAFQKRIVLLVCLLGLGVLSLEIIGTQFFFSQTVYKLGPVMVEEVFEISMVSVILAKLSRRLLSPSSA